MKKQQWYRGLSLADDRYVIEAAPDRILRSKRKTVVLSLAAVCACFLLVFGNLWLFMPFRTSQPEIRQYADSEYYELIQTLSVLKFQPPQYKNNAEKLSARFANWKNRLLNGVKGETGGMDLMAQPDFPSVSEGEATPGTGEYKEVTDNQVEGIIEADRIKRSDTHIYYLDESTLRIFVIERENTREVGRYLLYDGEKNAYWAHWEFYLSPDCQTVTVITEQYDKTNPDGGRTVKLIALDVSDPTNVVKKKEISITGSYLSSRMTKGGMLLLTEFVIPKSELNFDNESTFLPQIDTGDGPHSISASDVVLPETLSNTRYTVVIKLDESTLDLKGTAAYLSYSEDVYVSENHVFLTHVFAEWKEKNGETVRNTMTKISCLAYDGDTIEQKGDVTIRGYVKDQWSMDEYEGILRVFTTTNETLIWQNESTVNPSISADILQTATGKSSASLYCVDLSTFEIVASVIDFAPPYEEIQSARFDKDMAYACTSIELSDPVFFFDLSDLDHITYRDTGTIEGFSTSLIQLGNGYLLGIGRGDRWSSFKVEVYEETGEGVRSVCTYEIDCAEYATEYKSYYVDRQNQLIGLGIVDNTQEAKDQSDKQKSRYILLRFDGYELVELVNVPLAGQNSVKRGVYIDGYMYMFGTNDFKVERVFL